MDLQNRLKDFIKTKKRTISSVAKAVDVSTATLHLWMNNKYEGTTTHKGDERKRLIVNDEPFSVLIIQALAPNLKGCCVVNGLVPRTLSMSFY